MKYEVLIGTRWFEVAAAEELEYGWLRWKDHEGYDGLARPGDWRCA